MSGKSVRISCRSYKGVIALRKDDGLLKTVHHDPPQLLQHSLKHSFLTHRGKQHQTAHKYTQIRAGFRYTNGSFYTGEGVFHSLCIQEVHQWPQHVIRVGLHLVTAVGADGTFDLVQQTGHLTHAVINTALETTEEHQSLAWRRNVLDCSKCKSLLLHLNQLRTF